MIDSKKTPCLFKPFVWLWNLIVYIVSLTGRFLAVILGLLLIVAGIILTITVVGALLGIPLVIIGVLLVIRGLW